MVNTRSSSWWRFWRETRKMPGDNACGNLSGAWSVAEPRIPPRRGPGAGWLAPCYDFVLAPLEHRGLGRWRRRAWQLVPRTGLGLEIGIGTGANIACHPPDATVVAIDLSRRMLDRARRKDDGSTLFVAADVQALPFRDRAFDWAADTLVFCEVAEPLAGFRELHRVLRPGAPLVLLEHVRPSGWLGRVADALTLLTRRLYGEHFDRDPEAPLVAAGFRIQERWLLWRDAVKLLLTHADGAGPAPGPTPGS
jgi:phosphatidylethanolamine/phosphatidyl-N-methylethanolamine N-methyltransferase